MISKRRLYICYGPLVAMVLGVVVVQPSVASFLFLILSWMLVTSIFNIAVRLVSAQNTERFLKRYFDGDPPPGLRTVPAERFFDPNLLQHRRMDKLADIPASVRESNPIKLETLEVLFLDEPEVGGPAVESFGSSSGTSYLILRESLIHGDDPLDGFQRLRALAKTTFDGVAAQCHGRAYGLTIVITGLWAFALLPFSHWLWLVLAFVIERLWFLIRSRAIQAETMADAFALEAMRDSATRRHIVDNLDEVWRAAPSWNQPQQRRMRAARLAAMKLAVVLLERGQRLSRFTHYPLNDLMMVLWTSAFFPLGLFLASAPNGWQVISLGTMLIFVLFYGGRLGPAFVEFTMLADGRVDQLPSDAVVAESEDDVSSRRAPAHGP